MSALPALVSVDEYLRTVYEPDCDYVDGVVLERNRGEKDHAKLQKRLMWYLDQHYTHFFTIQETRVQISKTRFRVPDVCLFTGPEPNEQIFTCPPFLCIEVLSPEDRMSRMYPRIADYLGFGVAYVWVIEPPTRKAWIHTDAGVHEVQDGVLRTDNPAIAVPLEALF